MLWHTHTRKLQPIPSHTHTVWSDPILSLNEMNLKLNSDYSKIPFNNILSPLCYVTFGPLQKVFP